MRDMRYIAWAGHDLAICSGTTTTVIVSGTEGDCTGYGTIEIEPSWNLIAVPVKHGYWSSAVHDHVHDDTTVANIKNYIIDQIEDLYGAGKVEVANAYFGDDQFFRSFVVGVTPSGSLHNFVLVNTDNTSDEISGFWIKSLNGSTMTISWGEL